MDKVFKEDIRELISREEEPCVTLYMPTSREAGNDVNKMKIRMKNLIKKTEQKLKKDWGFSEGEINEFLKAVKDLIDDRDFWLKQSLGLAVFISQNEFSYYRIPLNLKEELTVAKNFDIKQIIPELFEDRRFYVLALSKNNNRFFRCTKEDIREIELEKLPDGIEDTLKYDDPEKTIQYHSNSANGSAIYHGQGVTDEDNKEDFMRYLREVDDAVYDYLNESEAPLIIMSVKELFALYNKVNSYKNLLDDFVKGSPDKIKDEIILEKARKIVTPHIDNYKDEVIENYEDHVATNKTEDDLKKILKNSYYAKIDYLLIRSDIEKKGYYNPDENELNFTNNRESFDLLNYAATQTIKNGGEVYIIEGEKLPTELDIAAVYRY